MIIPKQHIASLADLRRDHQAILGKDPRRGTRAWARERGFPPTAFRVIINTGRVGRQEVYHLHVHVIGGPQALGPMLNAIERVTPWVLGAFGTGWSCC